MKFIKQRTFVFISVQRKIITRLSKNFNINKPYRKEDRICCVHVFSWKQEGTKACVDEIKVSSFTKTLFMFITWTPFFVETSEKIYQMK